MINHIKINQAVPVLYGNTGVTGGIVIFQQQQTAVISTPTEEAIDSVDDGADKIILVNDVTEQFDGVGQEITVNGSIYVIASVATVSSKTEITLSGSPDLSGIDNTMVVAYNYRLIKQVVIPEFYESIEFGNSVGWVSSYKIPFKPNVANGIRDKYEFTVTPSQADSGISTEIILNGMKSLMEADGMTPANVVVSV